MTESAVLPAAEGASAEAIQLRPIEPGDRDAAARIVYEAFAEIHDHHRFRATFQRSRRRPTSSAASSPTR